MRAGLETGHSFRDLTTGCGLKADPGYWGGGGGAPTFLRKGPQQEGSKVVGETER